MEPLEPPLDPPLHLYDHNLSGTKIYEQGQISANSFQPQLSPYTVALQILLTFFNLETCV